MLTLHSGTLGGPAVVVRGDTVEAVGDRAALAARYPDARGREWAGTLRAALLLPGPVPDAPTPRERVHAVLRLGATAVRDEAADSLPLREAAARAGVRVVRAPQEAPALVPGARADLAVFARDGGCLATVLAGRLVHRRV